MQNNPVLREHLLTLLTSGDAHDDFETILAMIPPAARGRRPEGGERSPWEVLEHLRIAQWDLLEVMHNAAHVSPDFPIGYWPAAPEPPTEDAWQQCADAFLADRKAITDLIASAATDLFAPAPGTPEQTILSKVFLVADHNAYHLGQLVLLSDLLT